MTGLLFARDRRPQLLLPQFDEQQRLNPGEEVGLDALTSRLLTGQCPPIGTVQGRGGIHAR